MENPKKVYQNPEQNLKISEFFGFMLPYFDVIGCLGDATRHPEVSRGCLEVFTGSAHPIPHTRTARDGRRIERHPTAPIFRLPSPPRDHLSRTMFIYR